MFTRIIFVKKRGFMSNIFVSSTGTILNLDHVMTNNYDSFNEKHYILFRDGKESFVKKKDLDELCTELRSRRTFDTLKWIAGGCFLVIGLVWWTKE